MSDARERLRAALEAMDVRVDPQHGVGFTDRREALHEALRAAHDLLAEPPSAGDAALLRELREDMERFQTAAIAQRVAAAHGPGDGPRWDWSTARWLAEHVLELLARAAKGAPAAAEPEPARDALLKRMLDACEAKDDMLACYRVSRRPSEALFKRLDKANKAMEEARAALGRSS